MNKWIESHIFPVVFAFAAGVLVMSIAHDEREHKARMQVQEAKRAAMACRDVDVLAYYRSMKP